MITSHLAWVLIRYTEPVTGKLKFNWRPSVPRDNVRTGVSAYSWQHQLWLNKTMLELQFMPHLLQVWLVLSSVMEGAMTEWVLCHLRPFPFPH